VQFGLFLLSSVEKSEADRFFSTAEIHWVYDTRPVNGRRMASSALVCQTKCHLNRVPTRRTVNHLLRVQNPHQANPSNTLIRFLPTP